MNITYIYADSANEWNSSEWRCAIPAGALNRTGRHVARMLDINEFMRNSVVAQDACAPADVLIVQRNPMPPVQASIVYWKARGKVVIFDFDDAFNLMEPTNNANDAYNFWVLGKKSQRMQDGRLQTIKISPSPLTQFKRCLRLVDGVTVPSRVLANDWREYADVRYVPNYIELGRYQRVIPSPHEGIIIGWGGSASHLTSFAGSGILAALEQVCQRRTDVKVMICGNDPRILQALPIPDQQKIGHSYVSHEEWPQILTHFDLGLAPLHGAYDDRRSWIKVLEYMVLSIPWLASRSPAYEEYGAHGILVKNGVNTWLRALLDAIDRISELKRLAATDAHKFGIAQGVDDNIESVVSTYGDILSKSRQRR